MRYPTVHFRIGLSVCVAIGLVFTSIFADLGTQAQAREGNRTLKLYFGHTKERGEFTFKRNGRYDKSELARINRFLRDWRRNEPANMDPRLLDLIWAIYRESGSRDYIHVVSAYRSPATNKMLRGRSSGVAEKSQHMVGKAMDWYVTDVPLPKLRAIAMKIQGGGVGYYPNSGSPFIHTDTGNVRAWPRMSRQQLIALFPNGDTLHLPADGKPLPGYERAVARRKAGGDPALAYLQAGSDRAGRAGGNRSVAGWLKRVFDGGADEAEDNELASAPMPAAPAPAAVPSAPVVQPASADPQVLIAAAEESLDARLPRARPQVAESETMLASVAAQAPAESAAAPHAIGMLAGLEIAPLPRSRPDPTLLAESLKAGEGPASLAIGTEDAIAALAARAEESLLAEVSVEADAPQIALAALDESAGPPPAAEPSVPVADSAPVAEVARDEPVIPPAGPNALAAANLLAEEGAAPRAAGARPVALAFAGAGLRAADEPIGVPASAAAPAASAGMPAPPAPAPAIAAAPAAAAWVVTVSAPPAGADPESTVAAKGDRIQPGMPAAAAPADPAYLNDADELARLITERAQAEFSGFALPQPADAPGLFAVPDSAASIAAQSASPKLPTLRFQAAGQPAAKEDESFLSRLFASLTE